MATSTWRQIAYVMEWVEDVAIDNPAMRVLDVGCGWGRYGAIIRDSWANSFIVGVDGVDRRRWHTAYDNFRRGTLPFRSPHLPEFDLVLLLDVIEHLPKEDGPLALEWCRAHGETIVSTPNGFMLQDGNELDSHKSGWTREDLFDLGATEVTLAPSRWRNPDSKGPGQLVAKFGATG